MLAGSSIGYSCGLINLCLESRELYKKSTTKLSDTQTAIELNKVKSTSTDANAANTSNKSDEGDDSKNSKNQKSEYKPNKWKLGKLIFEDVTSMSLNVIVSANILEFNGLSFWSRLSLIMSIFTTIIGFGILYVVKAILAERNLPREKRCKSAVMRIVTWLMFSAIMASYSIAFFGGASYDLNVCLIDNKCNVFSLRDCGSSGFDCTRDKSGSIMQCENYFDSIYDITVNINTCDENSDVLFCFDTLEPVFG